MDFEFNKIMGAVLGTLLFIMGIGFVAEAIYAPKEDIGPGYALPEPEPVVVADTGAPAVAAVPLATLLASASAERGAAATRKCQSCHNFGEGEPNKTGPLLYGVAGRPEGSHEGFAYSDGMLAHNAEGDVWTYENLDAFITAPKAYVPGTKMSFAGVKSPEERADILAYLQTLSPSPVPFPAADAAEPAGDADAAAPATDAAAPATEPTAPADVTATPTTTQGEAPAEGTPTTSGTDAAAPLATPAPESAPTPAASAPAATPAPSAAPAATPEPAATPAAPAASPVAPAAQ